MRLRHSLAALALAAVTMAGPIPQRVAGQELTTVNVGVLNTITDIPLILADRKGFFAAEGIKVNFTAFASTFSTTCRTARWSARTSLRPGGSSRASRTWPSRARGISVTQLARSISPKSTGSSLSS